MDSCNYCTLSKLGETNLHDLVLLYEITMPLAETIQTCSLV